MIGPLAISQALSLFSIEDHLSQTLQEPVAFWGGFTAGALALNLKEDPLRSWIERTAADAKVRWLTPVLHVGRHSRGCGMTGASSSGVLYSALCKLLLLYNPVHSIAAWCKG